MWPYVEERRVSRDFSMNVNDRRPRAIGRDWTQAPLGPLYQIPIFFISHFSPPRMKVDGATLKLLDIEALEFLHVVKSLDS